MSSDTFKGACLFDNTESWDLVTAETKSSGGYVSRMADKFIASREVCILHPKIFHKNKQMISFPHSKADGSFDNYEKLTDHFKTLEEHERNYSKIKERPGDAQVMINGLLRKNCIEIVDPKDLEKLTLNPADILDRSGGKTQLLVHWLGNACYSKPKLTLDLLSNCAPQIRNFKALNKTDLKQCYWQYKVSEVSSWQLGFSVNGVYYRCKALPFGPACAVYIVQSVNQIPMEFCRTKFGLFGLAYIDDFMWELRELPGLPFEALGINQLDKFPFLSLLKNLGYVISEHKTEREARKITFCGYFINLDNSTISIIKETIEKLHRKLDEAVVITKDGKFMKTANLESLLGLIGFCASCSEMGLSQCLELQLNFNDAGKRDKLYTRITDGMQQELNFWRSLLPGSSLKLTEFSTNHATMHIEGITPDLGWSDASLRGFGYKIYGEDRILYTGSGLFDDSLKRALEKFDLEWPENWLQAAIDSYEYCGFLLMVDRCPWNSVYLWLIDNYSVVSSFQKTRSKNRFNNSILKAIFRIMKERRISARAVWVSTKAMKHRGADDLSRQEYDGVKQIIRLSEKGVTFLNTFFPGEISIVFGSDEFVETHPDVKFTCFHEKFNDCTQNSGLDPFQVVSKLFSRNSIKGTIVLFPAPILLNKTIQMLEKSEKQELGVVVLIVSADKFSITRQRLREKDNLRTAKFQGRNKKGRLNIRPKQDYARFLGKY